VSRELTKIHEETLRGTVAEQIALWSSRPAIKGEIVMVVAAENEPSVASSL
jgi:16S rRNA (cytidine1402-2'-O)-methyltransferase